MKAKAKKVAKTRKGGALEGEGSYSAARNYDRKTRAFIAKNKSAIGKMAKDAETALAGPEAKTLRKAEKTGIARGRH